MVKKYLTNIDYQKIYCYFILFMMLYTSESIYTYVFWDLDHLLEIATDLLMLAVIKDLTFKRIKSVFIHTFVISSIMLLINLVNGVVGHEIFYLFGILLRIFSVTVFTAWVVEKEIPILRCLARLIVAIAAVFFVCFLCFDLHLLGIAPREITISYVESSDNTKEIIEECYLGIYYKWDSERPVFGISVPSVSGFWREPGVTQIYYNFALFYYLFLCKGKKKIAPIILLSFSVIIAVSTMGLLILLGLFTMKIIGRNKYTKICAPVIGAAVLALGIFVLRERYPSIAASSRGRNLLEGVNNWKTSPIYGLGYSRDSGSWYGLINYFINWGVLGIYPIIIVVRGCIRNIIAADIWSKLAFAGWWAASLLNEPVGYNMAFLMLYALIMFKYCMQQGEILNE